MVIKINPARVPVWRSPTSLQLGLGSTSIRLDNLTNPQEQLLQLLYRGVADAAIDDVARDVGASKSETAALVARVAPALIQVEEKKVKSDNKNLLVLHMTDRTGRFEIRSWNHSDTEFLQYHERPILLKRVRVSMYAGQRVGELLDGPHGTVVSTDFDSTDLRSYWTE